MRINATRYAGKTAKDKVDLDLVAFAALAHDLGHPPFGHNGELALDHCMKNAGGFEGNAQTLRILARLEKKGAPKTAFSGPGASDARVGLNLTYRTLAAILKYDQKIPVLNRSRPKGATSLCKGYYSSEEELVERIKKSIIGKTGYKGPFGTIECQIMDVADDIAYSTYDLEDALKAGFVSPIEILADTLNEDLMKRVAKKVADNLGKKFTANEAVTALLDLFFWSGLFKFDGIEKAVERGDRPEKVSLQAALLAVKAFATSQSFSQNGYFRNSLTTDLVDQFIKGVECIWNPSAPMFSEVRFSKETFPLVETLKHYNFEKLISSPRLKVAEFRGYEIVTDLFRTLENKGAALLPDDFRACYNAAKNKTIKKRVVCDFIAGMTDRYAIEFHGRLHSESPQTIFKPL